MIAEDILAFKQEIASHFDKSHGTDFGAFVSHVPLREFEEIFVFRIRDRQEIIRVKESMKNPKFWHTFRNRMVLATARAS